MGGKLFLEQNPIEGWEVTDYLVFSSSMLTRLAVEFVIVFFVLSGFSIAHSITKSSNVIEFYKKRLLRIYPPYIFAIIWAGLVYYITYKVNPEFYSSTYDLLTFERYREMSIYFTPLNVIGNLFYLPPMKGFIIQFWSLSYEIIFYILAPVIFIKRRLYYFLSILLFLLYIVFSELLHVITFNNVFLNYFLVYNFFFCVGIFIYQYFETINHWTVNLSKRHFIICTTLTLASTYGINIYLRAETVWSYLPACILGVLLIIIFLRYKIRIKPLIKIGKYSYTLYITHVASIFLFHTLYYLISPNQPLPYISNFLIFIPAIFFSLLIAYLQYRFVERKTKVILNRIRNT